MADIFFSVIEALPELLGQINVFKPDSKLVHGTWWRNEYFPDYIIGSYTETHDTKLSTDKATTSNTH